MVETTEMTPEMETTATGNVARFTIEQGAIRKIIRFFPYAMDSEEILMNISRSGLRFYASDDRRVRIGMFYVNVSNLAEFEYDGEQTFAIDPKDFKSVTNDLGPDALFKFEIDHTTIKLEAADGHKKETGTVYSDTGIFVPELNMPYGMRVDAKALYAAVTNLDDIGARAIRFRTVKKNDQAVLQLTGMRDEEEVTIPIPGKKSNFPEGETAHFPTEHLIKTLKLLRNAELLVRFKNDSALKVGVRLPYKSGKGEYLVKGYYLVGPLTSI